MANRSILGKHGKSRFLDIGAGAGRHLKLAAELGFTCFGIDYSLVGLQHSQQRLQQCGLHFNLANAQVLALPFRGDSFELVLSYGVFYYGTATEMKRAIAETHRVLAPEGRAFVVLRTPNDSRFAKGEEIEPNTFRITTIETNEAGTVQHFVSDADVPSYFRQFSHVSFEKSETTVADRRLLNSDWLITLEK